MIYMLFEEGYEEVEAIAVVDVLRRAKIDVKMIGMKSIWVRSSHGIKIEMDEEYRELNQFEDAEMIILPGGQPGTQNLSLNADVSKILKFAAKKNLYLSAICAAPTVFDKLGIIENTKITCYPSYASDIQTAIVTNEAVVVDGKIITGRGVGVAIEFGLKIVEVLKGKSESEKIKAAMVLPL